MPLLDVQGLTVRHVGPVDLAVAAGECLGLCGPSGSGKTLLLRAIADLEPHDGACLLDGNRAGHMAAPHWRRQVGYLAAEPAWWHDFVRPHFPAADQPSLETLGFATETLDWAISRLSSGEKQRLALLRLLARTPRVLLLDEPTANLDPANARAVEALLAEFRAGGGGIIWVSHDQTQLARVADRQIGLNLAGQLQCN